MSRQIIKKDNGKFVVWSTIVDDFIFEDITPDEYIAIRFKEEKERIEKEIREIFAIVDKGNPREFYLQFTMTYGQALARRKEVHGR